MLPCFQSLCEAKLTQASYFPYWHGEWYRSVSLHSIACSPTFYTHLFLWNTLNSQHTFIHFFSEALRHWHKSSIVSCGVTSRSFKSCHAGPPWIKLVVLAHPREICWNLDSESSTLANVCSVARYVIMLKGATAIKDHLCLVCHNV